MVLSRRDWLRFSGCGGVGFSLWALPHIAESTGLARGLSHSPIKSCILVFYYGGPSHFETFDPKPQAPTQIRGEYGTISTAVPGIIVSEHEQRTARIMDKLALVRSVHH